MAHLYFLAPTIAVKSLFFVNGSNGERMNQVGILEDSQRHHSAIGLGGLQVFSMDEVPLLLPFTLDSTHLLNYYQFFRLETQSLDLLLLKQYVAMP